MKLRIFAAFLALVLALFCMTACGEDKDNGKETDAQTTAGNETVGTPADTVVEGGTIKAKAVLAEGNKLVVTVSVENNPGIAGFMIKLSYDNTMLRPVEFADAELVDFESVVSNIQQGPEVVAGLEFVTAQYAQANNITGDGSLFTVVFDIIDASVPATYTFGLDCGDITNEKLQDMSFEVLNTALTVD